MHIAKVTIQSIQITENCLGIKAQAATTTFLAAHVACLVEKSHTHKKKKKSNATD